MVAFLTVLFTLRAGIVPPPVDPTLQFRADVRTVASTYAERSVFLQANRQARALLDGEEPEPAALPAGIADPPRYVIEKEDWKQRIAEALDGHERLADAAVWLASTPLKVNVSGDKVYLAFRFDTP